MDVGELQTGCLQSSTKLPVWIIEHVWAHKMMDIQGVIDPSSWPDVDSQPLSLKDSWRLRVASAQVYSIMKNRDMENFERAMGFLDSTYRLLPTLVPAIKHMKIMFGLKTMVTMWMLKEGQGMVDTVSKIGQFFPNKVPHYQDHCSQREMFLMRKNHLDFKSLAQTLAIDKGRLEDYIKNQMEEQYGEQYAQKLEDRLLHYLRELESVLPGDTYIDKILKKQSPVTEEEKLLLEVITSDSTTIAATLRKLLHCDVATCRPARISQSPESGKRGVEISHLSNPFLCGSSSKALLKPGEARTPFEFQPEVFRRSKDGSRELLEDSPVLFGNDYSDFEEHQQPEEAVKKVEEESGDKKVTSCPQFCSKHQRWVKSILRGCPDNCSEELLHQTNVSSSPLLFQSSSSTSSSQDLTPSDLVPCHPHQPPSQTSSCLHTAAEVCGPGDPGDEPSSGSPAAAKEHLPQPPLATDTLLPHLLSPVVRLVDIASSCKCYPTAKSHQVYPGHLTLSCSKQAPSSSSPQARTSGSKESMFVLPEIYPNVQAAPGPQNVPVSTSRQPFTQRTFSKLSRRFRQACPTTRNSQALTNNSNVSDAAKHNYSASTSQSENLSSVCSELSLQVIRRNFVRPHPQAHITSASQSETLPHATVVSSTSNSDCLPVLSETSRIQKDQLSRVVLLQSNRLEPCVSLTRMSTEECLRATKGRASASLKESVERKEMEENADSSFDVNSLYSSDSSSSDCEDSLHYDPNYRPHIKKKTLILEYESARVLQ
ncbi:uncharacterized protein PAE49_008419 [Odontesthes bonariensis]|uniref:uncharacterized protein LOC142384605 n=1 Tax=Odontesthes bonariensis TaxID=219752 RepID=UPI003F582C36